MTKKKLRPTTIIPKELYVERSADRQLRAIIDEMGRPGYVLVARQMGKTNLLINMRREREDDIVVYLDLSNRFESPRSWFRNVIDLIIESCPTYFSEATDLIYRQRNDSNFEPNVEYDRHLRLLLRSCNKRVIIVLDEIDSLIAVKYSDIVLAQVRSMYFSRPTYPEYERLTYVLSGVAEPSDLIKDKNISPFNIGEKIYLEDFSRSEFDSFIKKSGLDYGNEVTNAVYRWTSGNPRMTWDVCSEIESRMLEGECISPSLIDQVIEKMYLGEFDRAPVDHIRTLVEADPILQDAIVSIRYGKSAYLDSRTRSRLYLSGITKSPGGDVLEIKNAIIDAALPDEWLRQINKSSSNLLKIASESYRSENYLDALRQFELVFSNATTPNSISSQRRLEFALCYLRTGDLSSALNQFKKCILETNDDDVRQNANYYAGLVHVMKNSASEAIEFLESANNGPIKDIKIMARLTLMQALVSMGPLVHGPKALAEGTSLIDELEAPPFSDDVNHFEFLVSAIYNTALIHSAMGNIAAAEKELNHAASIALPDQKNSILLLQYDLKQNTTHKIDIIKDAARVIVENELRLSNRKEVSLRLSRASLSRTLLYLNRHGLTKEFDDLAKYTAKFIFGDGGSVAKALLRLFDSISSDGKNSEHIGLIEMAISKYFDPEIDGAIELRLLQLAATFSEKSKIRRWQSDYIKKIALVSENTTLDNEHYAALSRIALSLLGDGANQELELLFSASKTLIEDKEPSETTQWLALLSYVEMEFLVRTGKRDEAAKTASTVLSLIAKAENCDPKDEIKTYFNEIKKSASARMLRTPIKNTAHRKFGRNDKVQVRYGDSEVKLLKYKFVEADLRAGRCVLVD